MIEVGADDDNDDDDVEADTLQVRFSLKGQGNIFAISVVIAFFEKCSSPAAFFDLETALD